MTNLFDITVPEDCLKIPVLHWIPKFHKNPLKFRYIAGSKNKILTVLEVEVQKILVLLENHFKNYCEVIRQNSGYRYYFSINNSKQAVEMLMNVENPSSFDSYDFSNLYTNFNHDELIDKFKILLDILFTNAQRKNKGDAIRTEKSVKGKARWCTFNEENLAKYNRQKFWTKYKIIEAIEFLIKNAHVKFGSLIFRQICGIPMGMIPAPGFAKLGLGIDEFNYCSKLLKDKRIDILKKLINMVRYIDDVGVANFLDFGDLAKEIYPMSLVLNKSNDSGILNCAFLDLKVSVVDKKFQIQVYNKTDDYNFNVIVFPFLESNIVTDICYSVFFGEILRYLRICTKLIDFENRARMLVSMVTQRGYKRSELAKQFVKLFLRYRNEVTKYPGSINPTECMLRVIYYSS
jgi:sulfur relay (sulfurtransferase) DsrC/TusE family protein